MKNQVIKVLNKKHGKKVVEYFTSLGCDMGKYENPINTVIPSYYYGIINESSPSFDGYDFDEVSIYDAEIIELPINAETPKLPKLNKKKVGRPKLTQEQKVRIAKAKARAKKRFEEKELSKNLNSVLSSRIPTETYKLCEDAAKAKGKSISEYLRDEILNKKQPTQFDLPKPVETPKITKVLHLDMSILSNGKLSVSFECENHSLVNKLMADVSKLFAQQPIPQTEEPLFAF
jgi:hypothetical protein